MARHRIAVLSCWYNKYPWFFPYYLRSCEYNRTVDFYIITDNPPAQTNLSNVKFVRLPLPALKSRISEMLNMPVNFDDPYKLCDFRPAYGIIFKDILHSYDFWAHSDIDLVFGDIRKFLTDDLLTSHDVINSRHDYVAGHFCLFRNIPEVNTLFSQSKHYRQIFSEQEYFCFDECSFLHSELQNGRSIFDYPDSMESMTLLVAKAAQEKLLRAYFDLMIIEGNPGQILWNQGVVTYKNMFEAMYYHLIKFKKICKEPDQREIVPDKFGFTANSLVF